MFFIIEKSVTNMKVLIFERVRVSMDQHSKRREDYRAKRSSLNLRRNRALAAPVSKNSSGHLIARVIGIIATVAICFTVAWGAHMYFSIRGAIDSASGNNSATSAKIANKQPVSVLILGVDQGIEGRHDRGNSDTLILATANPEKIKRP